jgi:hypothetical protein
MLRAIKWKAEEDDQLEREVVLSMQYMKLFISRSATPF